MATPPATACGVSRSSSSRRQSDRMCSQIFFTPETSTNQRASAFSSIEFRTRVDSL
jgi:hypothetical protein